MKKKILIVDDEEAYRKIYSERFKGEGYTVLEGSGGQEGLDIAIAEKPDIILLDLNMPGMDGLTMLEHLRKDAWGKSAKVIILTNVSDTAKLATAIEHEAFIYLVKSDTSVDELVSRVTKTLE